MKKRVLTSVAASAVILGALVLTGCGGSSNGNDTDNGNGNGNDNGGTNNGTAMIQIQTGDGVRNIDPTVSGTQTVVINRNSNGTNNVAAVVHGELNECADKTTDPDGDGIICGPKEGVTYAFQSDFGKLGPIDNDPNTPDGGTLLYDALTLYSSNTEVTPVEPNQTENRIQEVYIPANYIKLTDAKKNASVDEQYNAMRSYLANICNMQCFAQEDNASMSNNPYFTDGKTKGRFVATFVMHFTRGAAEADLMQEFQTDTTNLEYLTVSFELDVEKMNADSSKLKFSVPADTPVTFGAKKHGQGALIVNTSNIDLNSIVHQTTDADHAVTINMARYFDKLIAKGDSIGVADYAKAILVENAQHPWPVKIYGTLHEIKDDGTYDRSFVRNPAKLDANLFGLTQGGAYKDAFINELPHMYERGYSQAVKFNIVYPGGAYNDL